MPLLLSSSVTDLAAAADTHTEIHTNTYTYIDTQRHIHIDTHTQTYRHVYTYRYTEIHILTRHTHNTYIQIHSHIYSEACSQGHRADPCSVNKNKKVRKENQN